MANEKILQTRIKQKHAAPEVWESSSFVPFDGELIVYDYADRKRVKIGNGTDIPKDLPFVTLTEEEETALGFFTAGTSEPGQVCFMNACLTPDTSGRWQSDLGADAYPWRKLFLKLNTGSGINLGGTLIDAYKLACLSGLRMNVQSELDNLGSAIDTLSNNIGGPTSFREAEFADFDTYYKASYSLRDYSLVPRNVAMGRRGYDINTMTPYVYRPIYSGVIDNSISTASKLQLPANTDIGTLPMTYQALYFGASHHYLYDKTAGIYYRMIGSNTGTVPEAGSSLPGSDSSVNSNSNSNPNSNSNSNSDTWPNTTSPVTVVVGESGTDLHFDTQENGSSVGYLEIYNSAWGYDPTHEYIFYAMDWCPLFELAENTTF